MDWQDGALVLAGIIGSCVAIVHGVLVQRRMVEPLQDLAATRMPRSIRVLVAGLLHFSTFNWFVGGLALIACAFGEAGDRISRRKLLPLRRARQILGIARPPPAWVLYGIALFLIACSIGVAGGRGGH